MSNKDFPFSDFTGITLPDFSSLNLNDIVEVDNNILGPTLLLLLRRHLLVLNTSLDSIIIIYSIMRISQD